MGSLVKPGNNLTGIKAGGHSAKALDWFLKVVPYIKIFVPLHNKNKVTVQSLQDLQQAAGKVGISVTVQAVSTKKELAFLFRFWRMKLMRPGY